MIKLTLSKSKNYKYKPNGTEAKQKEKNDTMNVVQMLSRDAVK